MAYLEIHIGEEVRRFLLDGDRLRIGRLAENDIVLRDAQISRQHAELRLTSGHWRILDLGSTNGLHVKGKRVQEHHLNNGDVLLLAPNITVRFLDAPAPADVIVKAGPRPPLAALPPHAPVAPSAPAPPADHAPYDGLRPRSPYADDEQPYYPPGIGMPAPPTRYNREYSPGAAAGAPAPNGGQGYAGQTGGHQNGHPSDSQSSRFDTIPAGGYPVPVGPLMSGSDGQDPFRRSGANIKSETSRVTAGPTSMLLHVCQTCGQLTAPEAVYCQNCHHSIARECVNCRLSLLPIQDRCPRCQTPNPGSVRRAHRASGA